MAAANYIYFNGRRNDFTANRYAPFFNLFGNHK
jgi:hypothetical protein